MRRKPVWLRSSTAARRSACLLCFLCPHWHWISLRTDWERNARHHLGIWQSSTSTSMGETKSLSSLTMSLWSLCSKRKFTSHPSARSECAWPYKSTIWKFNTRKEHSCTLQMPWVWWGPGRVLWDSCTQDGESRRVYLSWTPEARCFPTASRWRCWYPGTNPCDQARLARKKIALLLLSRTMTSEASW